MRWSPVSALGWLFAESRGVADCALPRWLFLRHLARFYFSAFFSLVFQIRGLIGPGGISPAGDYLQAVTHTLGLWRGLWYSPTLFWWSSGSVMLMALCWVGMVASVLLLLNFWPRAMLVFCFVCFLSFVSAAQDFSGYQSDGMLLEAGFLSFFLAPPGLRPGPAGAHPTSRASLFLLEWEWFRIYFQSGVVKLLSGDPQWRNFTAMDEYYQNGPLPTWIGWCAQHLPHYPKGYPPSKVPPHILKANCVTMLPKGHELDQVREFSGHAHIISSLRYTSEIRSPRDSSIGLSAAARTIRLIWRTESDPQPSTGKPNTSHVISNPPGACVQIAGAR